MRKAASSAKLSPCDLRSSMDVHFYGSNLDGDVPAVRQFAEMIDHGSAVRFCPVGRDQERLGRQTLR